MATVSLPELKEKLVIPAVSSSYLTLGANYRQDSYEIDYASGLIRTGKNYYDSKAQIPEGLRMSRAGEELAIQLSLERAEKDPRKTNIFNDIFARGPEKIYMCQWTETGLRVPKGRKVDKYETDRQSRKYWVRELLEENKVVGEILVPEGNGRLVAEWDEVSGVPRVTIENQDFPHNPYITHFWFNKTPDKDSISDHYDVAVVRWSLWPHLVDEKCLVVDAYRRRLSEDSFTGFRLVRGVGPEDPKIKGNSWKPVMETPVTELVQQLDPTQIEQAFLERLRTDYRSMSHLDFMKKYDL